MQAPAQIAMITGAVTTMTGLVVLYTTKQLGIKKRYELLKTAAVLLYIGGWCAWSAGAALVTADPLRRALVLGLSATVVVSTLVLYRVPGSVSGMVGFVAGWAGLAGVLGSSRQRYALPITGAAAVASGMAVMPWQRARGLVDGPGLPLQAGGWALLVSALA